jgi:hypothetical protein
MKVLRRVPSQNLKLRELRDNPVQIPYFTFEEMKFEEIDLSSN